MESIQYLVNNEKLMAGIVFSILVPLLISIYKSWTRDVLYQPKSFEQVRMVVKNIYISIVIVIVSFLYLVLMISLSLSRFSNKEVIEYLSNWNGLGTFIIMLILYSSLFAIVLLPLYGEKIRKQFLKDDHNNKVEVINREIINGKDKLILSPKNNIRIEKDVTNFEEIRFEIESKRKLISSDDLKRSILTLKDLSRKVHIFIFVLLLLLPTLYITWHIKSFVSTFKKIHYITDIFMYIGLWTLPLILIIELYYVSYLVYKLLLKNK